MIRPPPKYPLFPSPPFSRPLEEGEGPPAGFERVLEFPRHDVDVGQATLSEGANVVEASEVGQGDRFRAVDDGDLGPRSREAVEEARPAEPGRAALRIGVQREVADGLEGLDLLGMAAEGKHDL